MAEESIADYLEGITDAIGYEEDTNSAKSEELGKKLRKMVPRSSHAFWQSFPGRPDPVDTLISQGAGRVAELLPIRYQRMSVSPFAFYRGNALGMAIDLSHTPNIGVQVQASGDAHIANFGFFASPEGRLVFDLNDFDETFRAPWEWDIKRLAASVQICGENRNFNLEECSAAVLEAVAGYQDAMNRFAQMGALEVWNARIEVDNPGELVRHFENMSNAQRKMGKQAVKKARTKNNARAVRKLTEVVDGKRRIISNPPLIVPLRDLIGTEMGIQDAEVSSRVTSAFIERVMREYMSSLRPDAQILLAQYKGVDMARKVVGVGSVGTRCWILVLQGTGEDDYLVLQIKEAQKSVLEDFVEEHEPIEGGKRVVQGQRAMQLVSDPLLGYASAIIRQDVEHDFYIRQLWNSKGAPNLDLITPEGLKTLARMSGLTLARAHARTGNRFQIASYLGKGQAFGNAMVSFAQSYALQNLEDYQAFKWAYDTGRLG